MGKPPIAGYPDGDYELYRFLGENIRYPQHAKEHGMSGTVYIKITIDESGKPINYEITRGVYEYLDNEALRVLKMIKEWDPAIHKGKPITSSIVIPVSFIQQ